MLSARVEHDLLLRFRALVHRRGATAEEVLTAALEQFMSAEAPAGQEVPRSLALKPGRRPNLQALERMDEPVVILGLDPSDEGEGDHDSLRAQVA